MSLFSGAENQGNRKYYFSYSGSAKEVYFPRGRYFLELWGASGGGQIGGKGGYSTGRLTLLKGTKLYFYIGGQGKTSSVTNSDQCINGGWNGGGRACSRGSQTSGGGGTDIRLTSNSEYHGRIIVAGGGGGSASKSDPDDKYKGGYGGGNVGENVNGSSGTYGLKYGQAYANGGSQTSGGSSYVKNGSVYINENGQFGVGGASAGGRHYGGSGGGGYYGGGGGFDYTGGGGGSGYFNPLVIDKGSLLGGNQSFDGKTAKETGHTGDGAIRVTVLSLSIYKTCHRKANLGFVHYMIFNLILEK